ncbi:hypothetical protein V6N13_087508 [Hibiscus sabdariffa]
MLVPCLFFFLIGYLAVPVACDTGVMPYTPIENITIDCGSSIDDRSLDGRTWVGDVNGKFTPLEQPNNNNKSFMTATTLTQNPVDGVPYSTARPNQDPILISPPGNSPPGSTKPKNSSKTVIGIVAESGEAKLKPVVDDASTEADFDEETPFKALEDDSGDVFSSLGDHVLNSNTTSSFSLTTTTSDSFVGKDSEKLLSKAVFSEIRNPQGR